MAATGEVLWSRPNARGELPSARSGHTLTVVNDGRTHSRCFMFGGGGITPENRGNCFNDVHVLSLADPAAPVWSRPAVGGDPPLPRWRHTATLLPDNTSIFVFGGQASGRRYNDTHVFDTESLTWLAREVAGTPPTPRSHHTATLVEFDEEEDGDAEKKVFIIGGYGGVGLSRDFLMDVHALDLDTWAWSRIERIKGTPPRPRADHTVCVAGSRLILMGGRGQPTKRDGGHFDDVHVLELLKQEWQRPATFSHADERSAAFAPLPSPLWNHTAVAIESVPSFKAFVFGGQRAPLTYSDALHVLDVGEMRWVPSHAVGAPPCAREDCGVAYDSRTCNVVYFGGWAQGWLGDLWLLNVSGVVGPPYAVTAVQPTTGPITGNTPLTISGLNFPRDAPAGTLVAKFTDGRREATVPAVYVSPGTLSCRTPSFERFGALDVNVRVSAGEAGFTVNKCAFSFYVNTRAAKCTAFGPAVLAGAALAGTEVVLVMQAKDSAGKDRTSGGDAIRVLLTGLDNAAAPAAEPTLEDADDGRYRIRVRAPSPGAYSLDVLVDENAFDDDDEYIRIRGSPFEIVFASVWADVRATGAAPAVGTARVFAWAGAGGTVRACRLPPGAAEALDDAPDEEDLAAERRLRRASADGGAAPAVAAPDATPAAGSSGGGSRAGGSVGGSCGVSPASSPRSISLPTNVPVSAGGAAADPAARAATSELLAAEPPAQVWSLDPSTREWAELPAEAAQAALAECAARDAELHAACERNGLPAAVARALSAPHSLVDFAAFELGGPVAGEPPAPRRHFAAAVGGLTGSERSVWIYGGETNDGAAHDDLYELAREPSAETWRWRCHYAAELDQHAAIGRALLFAGAAVVSLRAKAQALDAVSTLDVAALLNAAHDTRKPRFDRVLAASVGAKAKALSALVGELGAALAAPVERDDAAALRALVRALQRVRTEGPKVEYALDQLSDALGSLGLQADSAQAAELRRLDGGWKEACRLAPAVRKAIKPLQDGEGARVLADVSELRGAAADHRAAFLADPVFASEQSPAEAYARLDALHASLAELERRAAEQAALAELFELSDAMSEAAALIADCRADLVAIKRLWDFAGVVESTQAVWRGTGWLQLDVASVEAEARLLLKGLRAHDRRVRGFGAFGDVEATIKQLLVALPCVAALRSPCMQERHWAQLAELTGVPLQPSDSLRLADLLGLRLHLVIDGVGLLLERARSEERMVTDLRKLEATWQGVQFEREAQDGGEELAFLRLRAEDLECLEENQLLVQSMLASRHLPEFQARVAAWQDTLAAVADVHALVLEMQRRWKYLRTLYIRSDEVKREMPDEARQFVGIDAQFRAQLGALGGAPNVASACTADGAREALEEASLGLERCEKTLANYLELKRRAFPRFYFVSTAMLLDVLSHGNRPELVVLHVESLMQAVASVQLAQPATAAEEGEGTGGAKGAEVLSLTSIEAEVFAFTRAPARPVLEGTVEGYLSRLIDATRAELRAQLLFAYEDVASRPRGEWLAQHVAQVVLLTARLLWTERTEEALARASAGSAEALADLSAAQRAELAELVELVQRELEPGERSKVMALITHETHARDMSARLLAGGVSSASDFAWLSQLRTRRAAREGSGNGEGGGELWVHQCDAELPYTFEYLGNGPRMVITPLTERVFITATQAAHLVLGCAPAGPAGMGKTETIKELATALGKATYVFNCGPEMDYHTVGDIFKGIASAGAWGSFAESDRLLADVLSVCSVQYKSVLDAQRARAASYVMEGVEYALSPHGCMAFLMTNPAYLGRSAMPESLKVLLRPVTVVLPDMQMIVENFIITQGFVEAPSLATKFCTLYRLLRDLLSHQRHYDWGLRAVRSAVVVAGAFRRAEPTQPEAGLLMRALRDYNLPKIDEGDVAVFLGLLRDLFHELYDSMPRKRDAALVEVIKSVAADANLQATDAFVQNVLDLQDLLDTRHSVFCIAPSGCNKTAAWQTLASAWTQGGERGAVAFTDINPKAVTAAELYGHVDMATRVWRDGLLSKAMREMAGAKGAEPKWIILDGDLDPDWIESLNSVMDDNRLLTLASNERIRLTPSMRLIFEIRDLSFATPATVTRAGILNIAEAAQWQSFATSWVERRRREEADAGRLDPAAADARAQRLLALFDTYCAPTLAYLKRSCRHMIPLLDFALVQSLCHMLDGVLSDDAKAAQGHRRLDMQFVFSAVWAFGGMLSTVAGIDFRKLFSKWWKETWTEVRFPLLGEVFDFYVADDEAEFCAWSGVVPQQSFDPGSGPISAVTVPTTESVSITFWLSRLVERRHPVLLVGTSGCGKTATINGMLRSLDDGSFVTTTINVNHFTNAAQFQRILEGPLEKKAGRNYGPPGGKRAVYFVDDLNMAAHDKYGTASNLALMRQHIGYGHVYDVGKMAQMSLLSTQYVAAMNPTAGSFVINPRLQRLFAAFAVPHPSAESLTAIFSTFVLAHVGAVAPHVLEVAKKVVQAALNLHKRVASTFRRTAAKTHYEFNMRHLSSVFQGVLMARGEELADQLGFVQLWLHESERVYGDQLVTAYDLKQYRDLALEQQRRYFKEFAPALAFAEPLIFSHFAQGMGKARYAKVDSFGALAKMLETSLDEYNEQSARMDLVLFEDAMRHVCRISRIIKAPGGHALLVGVGGSGKQSLTRLAAFVSGYSVVQLDVAAAYGVNELRHDLQLMARRCGVTGDSVVFLLTDQQIVNERFLVFINDLLLSGEVPGLFPPEGVEEINAQTRPALERLGKPSGAAECWAHFLAQVRTNLRVVLAFSPAGEAMKVRTRRFPALVNCVTIDWFQPWPEEALLSVAKRFLADVELGSHVTRASVCEFMAFSFTTVNALSQQYFEQERRHNWTTPKSFLELITLFAQILSSRRKQMGDRVERCQSALHKLQTTADSVSVLEARLQSKQREIEEKRAQCDALVPQVAEQRENATEEARLGAIAVEEAAEKEGAVAQIKAKIDADLAAATPALEKAAAALDSLNRKDLSELRSLAKPPPGIEDVTGAVVCLLGDGSRTKPDTSWKAAVALMKDLNVFLADLVGFRERIDSNAVPKQNFKHIRPLLEKEWFNVDTMGAKSSAAAGLCEWVLNITEYWDINENIEPMRQAAQQAEMDLKTAIRAKDAALRKAVAAQGLVQQFGRAYEAALAEKDAVIAEGELCARKLSLAQRLMVSLGSEGGRWRGAIATLNDDTERLVGDVLLSAAFVAYAGCFNKRFRHMLIDGAFVPYLQEPRREVLMSDAADPLSHLTTEVEIAQWSNENLPTDRASLENGAIVCNSARWPLMIDPQLQGITWIRRREAESGVSVLRQESNDLLRTLELAMARGKPVLIEGIGESIDAILSPLLARRTARHGGALYVKLGDRELELDPGFRLYLQTKLTNPHFPPEVQAETTLVNFSVTEDGLEDQLLALTASKERPDLEERKLNVIQEQNGYMLKIKNLEESILAQLASAEGDILENITLIENLEASARIAASIAEKASAARQTELTINQARETYRRVAARGALVYFLLAELPMLHSFFQYSLNAFLAVYEHAITGQVRKFKPHESSLLKLIMPNLKEKPRRGGAMWNKVDTHKTIAAAMTAEQLEERVASLIASITYNVFSYARRGLFASHKLIVATQLMFKVMRAEGELVDSELQALIRPRGNLSARASEARPPEYLSEAQWSAVLALKELEDFRLLPDDLENMEDYWQEWISSEQPEELDAPQVWSQLSPMQHLLLLRALRPDRVLAGLRAMVVSRLGESYVSEEPFMLSDCFASSSSCTPLLFVIFPGVDPSADIERMGTELGFTLANKRYVSISMGQGQEAQAESALLRLAKEGGWVFLQNVHLMQSWLPTLEKLLDVCADTGHSEFRCFLSAEPPHDPLIRTMPESILQAAIKIANEPPTDIKANMRAALATIGESAFEGSIKPDKLKPMMFALAFFHALMLGRRRFGTLGFSCAYPFSAYDFSVCADLLKTYVEAKEAVPWSDLRYLIGDIMYGGHVIDAWDQRCAATYLESIFVPELLKQKGDFVLAPGLRAFSQGTFADARVHIDEKVPDDSPALFGIHANAETAHLVAEAEHTFASILELSGAGGGGRAGSSAPPAAREAVVMRKLGDLQLKLPHKRQASDVRPKVEGRGSPYVVFFSQEIERLNLIVEELRRDMAELELGLTGTLNITDAMDTLISCLYLDMVPLNWLAACGQSGPNGPYTSRSLTPWFADLMLRDRHLADWEMRSSGLPPSVWISGLFNPMGFVTACLQVTARAKQLPLDSLSIRTTCTSFPFEQVDEQPEEGSYCHGLFLEGARWSSEAGSIVPSMPKELHAAMPVIHIHGVPLSPGEETPAATYSCPVYAGKVRGPTYQFTATLPSPSAPAATWVLAGVCLLMSCD